MAYFAASCDDVETNRKFAESLQLDYPILSDPDKKVVNAYGMGRAKRWTWYIGPDGDVLYVDKKVSVGSHGEDVVRKLAELGVAKKEDGK